MIERVVERILAVVGVAFALAVGLALLKLGSMHDVARLTP
jgi:hypothetical protein